MPRWVKIYLIVAGVLFFVLLVALLSGGKHGPGRHFSTTPGVGLRTDPSHVVIGPPTGRSAAP